MRDDLLEAQASVDWAVSKLPLLKQRLGEWCKNCVEVTFEDLPPPETHNLIVTRFKETLPLAFTIEVGAYINVIRSSLDILACAIGRRVKALNPHKHYFPVAASAEAFAAFDYRGSELIRHLPRNYRDIFEFYLPYHRRNDIGACHHLDNVRKHQRLLSAYIRPHRLSISDFGLGENFAFATDVWTGAKDKTIIGKFRKGAPRPDIQITAIVAFAEPEELSGRGVVSQLKIFALGAYEIIQAFDIP